jgi:23S rRNA (cytidine1920-2'-O)/16S rRNA (cytidine1409-2'-O)-methyltransferase
VRYVGRGGHKLAGALDRFEIAVAGRDALDVGASTGGFTQVLLEAGARRVVALDVGRGQLDWGLRGDPRVFPVEGVNARFLDRRLLPFVPSLATVDVSFISLRQVLPAVVACCDPESDVLALAKPQFEVGRGRVGRGGIVRDPALHREVLLGLAQFAVEHGWAVAGACASPLPGATGNREFFLHLRPGTPDAGSSDLDALVDAAMEGGAA